MGNTVLIVDDHPIFRVGLCDVLDRSERYRVVGEATDGASAIEAAREHKPAFAVLDIAMPKLDGLEVLAQLTAWHDAPACIMLTMFKDYGDRALSLGARGYVLKERATRELVRCLDTVSRGEIFVSDGVVVADESDRSLEALTPTERRVVRLLAEVRTSREIAQLMSVSPRTIQNHRYNICKKLGLEGPSALLRYAAETLT